MSPTREQHAEVAIAVLNHIAKEDGIPTQDREDMGLESKTDLCLLCDIYGHRGLNVCHEARTSGCPGSVLCERFMAGNFSRQDWVNAYRFYSGRA